jgi:hypothetical protein
MTHARIQYLFAFALLGTWSVPTLAQQAGTIGSMTSTTVSKQIITTDTTTTTNNLSQSLILNASGVSAVGPESNLVKTSLQNYTLETPNGSIQTQLRTTELNPTLSFIPTNPGADLQLSITNELPGIKVVSIQRSTSDTESTTNSFSVYTAPLSQ